MRFGRHSPVARIGSAHNLIDREQHKLPAGSGGAQGFAQAIHLSHEF
jgi:hypothetical protein